MLQSYKITHPYFKTINCYYKSEQKDLIYYDLNDIIRVLKITNVNFIKNLEKEEYISFLKGKKNQQKLIAVTYDVFHNLIFLSNDKEHMSEFFDWVRFMREQ